MGSPPLVLSRKRPAACARAAAPLTRALPARARRRGALATLIALLRSTHFLSAPNLHIEIEQWVGTPAPDRRCLRREERRDPRLRADELRHDGTCRVDAWNRHDHELGS